MLVTWTSLLWNAGWCVARTPGFLDRWLYAWQIGRFIGDQSVRQELVASPYDVVVMMGKGGDRAPTEDTRAWTIHSTARRRSIP
jgi:hypothetical protein